jgi:predicted LPLAT superfamily acyltransferase
MASDRPQQWTVQRERGALPLIKVFVWVALRLGRPIARLFLYPICLYYLMFATLPRRASRQYLTRVLGHPPGFADLFRHYHAFASCALDRVFLLNDQLHLFDLQVHGEEIVLDIARHGSGCILLGAHIGSFEVTRTLGRRHGNLRISLLMYEENARRVRAALTAINPNLAMDVIGLGQPDSLIMVEQRLEQGYVVGLLPDRGINGEGQVRCPFLGSPAAFPIGPFQMAALLNRPVALMFGIYRGGRRYEVFFELLSDASDLPARGRSARADALMRRYVERIEHYCREAPFNWFNFYDFWA